MRKRSVMRSVKDIVSDLLPCLFWMLLMGSVQAQTDYSGTWYITNGSNYYLCPASRYYQDNYDMPYLTTYQTGKDKNSIWRVERVDDGGDTYYRFIHNASGKYLTANDVVDASNPARLRLHLEAFDTPTDATLFIVNKHSSSAKIAIRSKSYDDSANDRYWFDIANGNKGNYWNGNSDGTLGFWRSLSDVNNAAMWALETAPATCATPVITYDEASATFSIGYPGDGTGVSIHYTVDGTEPTNASATYSSALAEAGVTTKLRAIAVKDGYDDSEEAMVYGAAYSATPHLFKTSDYTTVDGVNSYYDFAYYLISPVDDSDNNTGRNYLTTSNVPNPRMQWLIKPAAEASGVQYYHIVNSETGKCVYFTGTNTNQGSVFVLKSRDESGTEADRFMFRIWERSVDGISFFNFSPKMISYFFPTNNKENFLTKQNNTNHNNPTGVYRDDNTGGRARWQMVDVPADPRTLSALPASMVSTGGSYAYFKLRNAVQGGGSDYFVYPPSSKEYATAATTGDNPEWYLQPADDADTWNTYYYIRNAETGNYLYLKDGAAYNENKNKFLTSANVISGDEDEYKFLVLKTANTTYSGTYHIVPKAIRNNNNQASIALNRNNSELRTSNSRDADGSCWYLDPVAFKCIAPRVKMSKSGDVITLTSETEGVEIYYSFSANPEATEAYRYTAPIEAPTGSYTLKAFAQRSADGSDRSGMTIFEKMTVTSGDEIESMDGYYYLDEGFTPSATPIGTAANPFRGTIDGRMHPFSLSHPFFGYVDGATIKNVIISDATVSSGNSEGDAGVIACEAKGETRIYNCGVLGGSVSGARYTGGLVGLLDGSSRVINCYSYATITGGSYVGGIVGYNNAATTSQNLKTMVMNCMFYGDITGGTNKAPIYNGYIITNRGDQSGVSNYNYFAATSSFVQNSDIQTYNCALMAEDRYLQRFEFFRHLLNGHRELAAWWATGDYANKDEMLKWVMEPSQIGTDTPYPILKAPGRYPSVVNYEIDGGTGTAPHLGTLSVTVRNGSGAVFGAPAGADITTSSLTLNITGKDPEHFNFNYYKVQLPYYNDVGTGNYRKASNGTNRVVTGWKIVSITGGTTGSFTTGDDAKADSNGTITEAPYNFADRNCTAKDLYSESGRVFNQGAYWDVPEGVTAITIEPYWAKATYLADGYADVVYDQGMSSAYNVPNVGGGQIYTNGNDYTIDGEDKTVYTTIGGAKAALGLNSSHTVYDYAIVLVGNAHNIGVSSSSSGEPYTIMSADFDHDNEPDYSYILRFNGRCETHPVRLDFINIPGLGMAQKSTGGGGSYNFGICLPNSWFESTNTSLFRVTQFEYDRSNRGAAPLILQGGVIEQWVSGQQAGYTNKTIYFHVGGNVWFKEFHRGTHQDHQYISKHPPISVTGGDYDEFYLTGLYRGDVPNYDDNAECYINGGRFGILAGTGQEGIGNASTHENGNIVWQIQNADIDEFYGGGINAAHPAEGSITTVITGGYIKQFYGGPKFGDMNSGRTVKTTATNCTFDNFYGAGYGGNSYSRRAPKNYDNVSNINWNNWINDGSVGYNQVYNVTYGGVETQYTYQFIPQSGNTNNVARLLVEYVSFSLATARHVTSTLTGCTINNNFYGGGRLGKVDGNVTSTLTDCTILGNVYGAGYSASLPTVEVMDKGGFQKQPDFNTSLGVFMPAVFPATKTYRWEHAETVNSTATAINTTDHILYTTEDLNTLGTVTGTASLTISGSSLVGDGGEGHGNIYGGGEESAVGGNTEVSVGGTTEVLGNVYGGGNLGNVSGSTSVTIGQ